MRRMVAAILLILLSVAFTACGAHVKNDKNLSSRYEMDNVNPDYEELTGEYSILKEMRVYGLNGDVRGKWTVYLNEYNMPGKVVFQEETVERYFEIGYVDGYMSSVFWEDSLVAQKHLFNEYGDVIESCYAPNMNALSAGEYTNKTYYKYKYDELGNILEKLEYQDGAIISKEIMEYDFYGNVCRYTYSNEDSEYIDIYDYEYENERIAKKFCYDDTGALNYSVEYDYNNKGDVITEQSYNSDGEEQSCRKYTYNGQGQLIKQESYELYFEMTYYSDAEKLTERENKILLYYLGLG